jgi:cysteine desulfurase
MEVTMPSHQNQSEPIFLDYAATTPVDPRVLQKMLPYFSDNFGNTSSTHIFGQKAEAALDDSRRVMAKHLYCHPNEIIFTSCGSESDNLALRGAALAARKNRNANHILISPVEHHAVSRTAQQLERIFGFELEYLPVDRFGMVQANEVRRRLRKDTAVVSVIYANNEIGTINPIAEIGTLCREADVPFHTDAVQAAAYLPVSVDELNVDMLALGAHKFYGPKGVGALYIRRGTPILSMQTGGSQEFGMRAGTHNVAYIAGMATAFDFAQQEINHRSQQLMPLRDFLTGRILEQIPQAQLTGHPIQRLPNHASFVFEKVDGNALLMMLDLEGFACSSGSACKTGHPEPSEVLNAIGLSPVWALGSLRVTLGSSTTADQIEKFCSVLPEVITRNRSLSQVGA